jgi:rhamnogalacturonan endolyase
MRWRYQGQRAYQFDWGGNGFMGKRSLWKCTLRTAGVSLLSSALLITSLGLGNTSVTHAAGARQMEFLDRGVVAVKTGTGVFVSWRLLGTEGSNVSFNVYRDGTKVNASPITNSTNLQDASGTSSSKYTVRAVVGGTEQAASAAASVWGSERMGQ